MAEVDESIFSGFKDVKKSSSPSNALSMASWVEAVSKITLSASSARAFLDLSFYFIYSGMLVLAFPPINELKEILNAAEFAEEFADDAPKWDDATSETRGTEMMPSTSKQAVPIINIDPSTFTNPEGTLDALASLPSKVWFILIIAL
ncbi:hypothetical protein TNCV_1359041 [Trichonephila clavipes]|nr:hypothetical protein TNCV_1359041 [Trichonephila clavipes]